MTKILGGPAGSSTSSEIFAESSLDSTLQSGQLDASSAFITQAIELHLDYIPLPAAINLGDAALAAQYAKATVTVTPPGGTSTTKNGIAAGHRHHDHRQAHPGRDRLRQVHALAGRPGAVQDGRIHAAGARSERHDERDTGGNQ